jgi:hypothetical protein
MNDERSDQVQVPNTAEGSAQCGPGCNCGSSGRGRNGKIAICLIIVAAAILVLGRSFARKTETGTAQAKSTFATTVPATTPSITVATDRKANSAQTVRLKPVVWGEPLTGLVDLNNVAAQQDAVFVYVPKKGQGPVESMKQQITKAAEKAQAGGMKTGCYTLDADSEDYAKVTSQTPAPCVMALAKGAGSSVVSGKITEDKLLEAVVTASRASSSSCGPSGCAPSTPGCN